MRRIAGAVGTVSYTHLDVYKRQVYLLSGIFPLVPGAGIYYAAFYLISGNMEMFSIKGTETVETAGAIVIGIILAMGLPQAWLNHLKKKEKKAI